MPPDHGARRADKLGQLIKEEVGGIILKDLDIDREMLLTVTRVEVSSDLAHATIFISAMAQNQEAQAVTALTEHVRDIQHTLNRRLRIRPVPKIRFAADASYKKEQRLYDILGPNHDADA